MPVTTEDMEADSDKARLKTVSDLICDFVGPLPEKSKCHICLDSWYFSSAGDDEILCTDPVRINHPKCQCHNIVLGRACITSWFLERDTCPMCRVDLVESPPAHLRRPPPAPLDEDGASDNDDTSVTEDFIEDDIVEDELEEQSWLYSNGNYVHSVDITNGEHFDTNEIVELFLNKPIIEAFKTEDEKTAYFSTRIGHAAASWELAYQELVRGKSQKPEDLYTVQGPICIDGTDGEGSDSW